MFEDFVTKVPEGRTRLSAASAELLLGARLGAAAVCPTGRLFYTKPSPQLPADVRITAHECSGMTGTFTTSRAAETGKEGQGDGGRRKAEEAQLWEAGVRIRRRSLEATPAPRRPQAGEKQPGQAATARGSATAPPGLRLLRLHLPGLGNAPPHLKGHCGPCCAGLGAPLGVAEHPAASPHGARDLTARGGAWVGPRPRPETETEASRRTGRLSRAAPGRAEALRRGRRSPGPARPGRRRRRAICGPGRRGPRGRRARAV